MDCRKIFWRLEVGWPKFKILSASSAFVHSWCRKQRCAMSDRFSALKFPRNVFWGGDVLDDFAFYNILESVSLKLKTSISSLFSWEVSPYVTSSNWTQYGALSWDYPIAPSPQGTQSLIHNDKKKVLRASIVEHFEIDHAGNGKLTSLTLLALANRTTYVRGMFSDWPNPEISCYDLAKFWCFCLFCLPSPW